MTHEDFVKAYKSGHCDVIVNKSLAVSMMNSTYVAKRYLAAHLFWSWVWLLSIPAAIALWIWVKWWIGLVVLIIGLLLPRAIKRSASEFVLEQALEDERFYNKALELQVLKVIER